MIDFPKKPITKIISINTDYYELFKHIQKRFESCYIFESLLLGRNQDTKVTMGFDPIFRVKASGNTMDFEGDLSLVFPDEKEITQKSIEVANPYYRLRELFPQDCMTKMQYGGLIGNFCHETVNYLEACIDLPVDEQFGQFEMGLFDDGLVYDMTTKELTYYYYQEHRNRIHIVEELLEATQNGNLTLAPLESVEILGNNITREEYNKVFKTTQEEILKGNTFQAEIGAKTHYNIKGNKLRVYDKLREVNPSPYMYYLQFGEKTLLGASPEILVSSINGKVLTTPTAGTVQRGATPEEDAFYSRKLLNDPKEIAEHNMLVDLHRNDLGKIAQKGTVIIEDLMYIIRFSHVQHIVSDISCLQHKDKDALDVLAATLPGGVLTGAPKIETIKIISRNETAPRGPYGGAVGRFSFNGDCYFCMPIRSLFCYEEACFAQTSSGAVLDSTADGEYDEIERKLEAMQVTIKQLQAETMNI